MSIFKNVKEKIENSYYHKLIKLTENNKTSSKMLAKISLLERTHVNVLSNILSNPNSDNETLSRVIDLISGKDTLVELHGGLQTIVNILENEHSSETLIKKIYFLFDEPARFDPINPAIDPEIQRTFLTHQKVSKDLVFEIYENTKNMPSKAGILLSPTVDLTFFNKEAPNVFSYYGADYFIECFIEHTIINSSSDDDYSKLDYLIEETAYHGDTLMIINDHLDLIPEKILKVMKTTDVEHLQATAFRHKSNSWENAQKEMFEFWQQDNHFIVLENPNVPEYVLKKRITVEVDGVDSSVQFWRSLIYNTKVSKKIFTLHSRSFVEETVYHVLNAPPAVDRLQRDTKFPEFLYLASFVNDVKKNNLDIDYYVTFKPRSKYTGLNVRTLGNVIYGIPRGEIAFHEDLDKHVQMIFALQEDLPETTVQKLSVSVFPEVRQTLAFAKHTSSKTLEQLSNDSDTLVRLLVAAHKSTNNSILMKLIDDPDPDVRESAYLNLDLSIDEIEKLLEQGDVEMVRCLARRDDILPSRLIDLAEHEDEIVRFNAFSNESLPEIYRDLLLIMKQEL